MFHIPKAIILEKVLEITLKSGFNLNEIFSHPFSFFFWPSQRKIGGFSKTLFLHKTNTVFPLGCEVWHLLLVGPIKVTQRIPLQKSTPLSIQPLKHFQKRAPLFWGKKTPLFPFKVVPRQKVGPLGKTTPPPKKSFGGNPRSFYAGL